MNFEWDKFKSMLSIALGVYPFFVGLYTAGLFWDAPTDTLGAFTFSDLLFKSSIIYAWVIGAVMAYAFLGSSVLAFIGSDEKRLEAEHTVDDIWEHFSAARKRTHLIASVCIVVAFAIGFNIDPWVFRIDPYGFAGILAILFMIGIILRVFVSSKQWRDTSVSYLLVWMIVGPMALGYADAQQDKNAEFTVVGGKLCSPVLIGTTSTLFRCTHSYVLADNKVFGGILKWRLSDNHPDVVSARRDAAQIR